ncbi:hypothetical protein GQX74_008276 [Glossina fuscipes]|nr:hypothetical protein GQX74_008276 [Glossina fuscipes]
MSGSNNIREKPETIYLLAAKQYPLNSDKNINNNKRTQCGSGNKNSRKNNKSNNNNNEEGTRYVLPNITASNKAMQCEQQQAITVKTMKILLYSQSLQQK